MKKKLILILLFPFVFSCTNTAELEHKNVELRDSLAILKNQIENERLLYKFGKIKMLVTPKEQEFYVDQTNEFLIAIMADEMYIDGNISELEIELGKSRLESKMELDKTHGDNILRYTPKEAGKDTLQLAFYFNNPEGQSMRFEKKYFVEIKQTANNR